jgi:hypothetical protein
MRKLLLIALFASLSFPAFAADGAKAADQP